MVTVLLEEGFDALLSQVSADLELSRPEVAKVLLESALLSNATR